jgi:hypothetical protein
MYTIAELQEKYPDLNINNNDSRVKIITTDGAHSVWSNNFFGRIHNDDICRILSNIEFYDSWKDTVRDTLCKNDNLIAKIIPHPRGHIFDRIQIELKFRIRVFEPKITITLSNLVGKFHVIEHFGLSDPLAIDELKARVISIIDREIRKDVTDEINRLEKIDSDIDEIVNSLEDNPTVWVEEEGRCLFDDSWAYDDGHKSHAKAEKHMDAADLGKIFKKIKLTGPQMPQDELEKIFGKKP